MLRYPEWLLQVASAGDLHRVLAAEEFAERLLEFLGRRGAGLPSPLTLARFRRRQLLRILLRDVLGLATLSDVTEELSNLADAILDFAYRRIRERAGGAARRTVVCGCRTARRASADSP